MKEIVDVENEVFQQDEFNVIEEIDKLIPTPLDNDFDYFKVVYLSLVEKYKKTIEQISKVMNKNFRNYRWRSKVKTSLSNDS